METINNLIWEEKNLIEPLMNLENKGELGQNVFMKDTNPTFWKNECKDIGIKKWSRNCPKCGKEVFHSNNRKRNYALKIKRSCRSCSKSNLIRTETHKQNLSKSLKGKPKPDYFKEMCRVRMLNISKKQREIMNRPLDKYRGQRKGVVVSDDVKRKLRLSSIKQIEKKKLNGGQMKPNYNINSCKYFDNLNKENGWNLQHAENGGEFYIKELGYWVDAYDKEKNIVVEYDESYHNKIKQYQKDLKRMNEIKQHLGCKFLRYNQIKETIREY